MSEGKLTINYFGFSVKLQNTALKRVNEVSLSDRLMSILVKSTINEIHCLQWKNATKDITSEFHVSASAHNILGPVGQNS